MTSQAAGGCGVRRQPARSHPLYAVTSSRTVWLCATVPAEHVTMCRLATERPEMSMQQWQNDHWHGKSEENRTKICGIPSVMNLK
jgi:hypothetical protein